MKVLEIRDGFGLDHLLPGERPEPQPAPCQVLLRMKAASLNYRDLMMVNGSYNPKQPLPLIPCSDGVGEVVAAGAEVRGLEVGDRVATLFHQKWLGGAPAYDKLRSTLGGPLDGALSEYAVFPEEGVIKVPEHLTDVEAATLPCAALTAWSALATLGDVGAGDTVLVQGTGGVSLFALQLGRALGARVIVTSSSDSKLETARKLGSWRQINYREDPEWGKTARQLTGGAGVDHIVEVGGAGTLAQSLRAIKIGGHISVIGVLSGHATELNILPILMQQVRIQGILVGSREGFEAMNRAIDHHRIRPVIDRVFPFDEAREALAYFAGQRHVGKVCIEFDGR
jgi:NADPH:quinone reductase-like Zn-dependent oxidoreductase